MTLNLRAPHTILPKDGPEPPTPLGKNLGFNHIHHENMFEPMRDELHNALRWPPPVNVAPSSPRGISLPSAVAKQTTSAESQVRSGSQQKTNSEESQLGQKVAGGEESQPSSSNGRESESMNERLAGKETADTGQKRAKMACLSTSWNMT